jgi:predicted dehydrogenase
MGRHHVRILSRMEGVQLVGGVDPAGDTYRSLAHESLHSELDGLLAEGIDAAVVAVPTNQHEDVAVRLADARVHTLIEKPLAGDVETAKRIAAAFHGRDLVAVVGHIERFNVAIQELHGRLQQGELGRVFSIQTERVGPYPTRIGDVGVLEDLATHDIDLVTWLMGEQFESVSAQSARQIRRAHDDLVEVIGRLGNGVVVRMSVNWLTPTKRRQVTVLGERGALVAELLNSDLTLYANSEIETDWDEMARLRGISEGDMIRYALPKREPLSAEVEHFRDAILGSEVSPLLPVDEAIHVIELVERIAHSSPSMPQGTA